MKSNKDTRDSEDRGGGKKITDMHSEKPEWTSGLRELYDSVVDEPLPDSFKDLLSKLDDKA